MAGKRGRLRALAIRLAVVLTGVIVALLIGEAVLRIGHLAPTGGVFTVNESEFDRIPGLFAPNQDVVDQRNRNLVHRVTTGSLGYRGRDFPRLKGAGELRIVMVGDSFTYGDFVNDDQTLPAQLESRLGQRCDDVLVVNAGVGGSTIFTQARLAQRAIPLRPDLVIVVFSENDIFDMGHTPLWERLAVNRRRKSRFPLSVVYPVLRHSALWNLVLASRERLRVGFRPPPARPVATAGDAEALEGARRETYADHLRSLKENLSNVGIPLAFVVYPARVSFTGSTERIEWAAGAAQDAGIPTLNLLPALRNSERPVDDLFLVPHDAHPSPAGYAEAAEHLADAVARWGLLAPVCGGTDHDATSPSRRTRA